MHNKLHQIKYFLIHLLTAKRRGHGVHSPFAYQLCEEVFYNFNLYYNFEELNEVRNQLLKDNTEINFEDFGAGSNILKSKTRTIKQIAKHGISSKFQSELIYKLINYFQYKTCVELGTSIGLNTLYMSKANLYAKIFSIDACKDLIDFSKSLATKNSCSNINFIHSAFDDALPNLFSEINTLDFLYIDGNHTYEATLNYFNLALEKINPNSLIILDDIYWSKEMTRAWEEIRKNPKVKLSIDTFKLGILFFREEIKEKIHFKFLTEF